MSEVTKSRKRGQHDDSHELLFEKPSQLVLEIPPPDMVEEISRYFEAGNVKGDKRQHFANDPAEESDSEDNLFITQNCVPTAVSSVKRCQSGLTSEPASPSEHEESEDDGTWSGFRSKSSNSTAVGSSKKCKHRRRKEKLRTYSFPFLECNDKHLYRRKTATRGRLISRHSASLGSFAIGGFLKCVKGLGNSSITPDTQPSGLPKVYIDDEESLSSLSEEEEKSDDDKDESFKVVEKRLFVTSLKARVPPTRHTLSSTQKEDGINTKQTKQTGGEKTKSANPRLPQKTPQMSHSVLQRAQNVCLETESPSVRDSSNGRSINRDMRGKCAIRDTGFICKTKTPKTPLTKMRLCNTEDNREDLSCIHGSEEDLCSNTDTDVYIDVTKPQPDIFQVDCPQTGKPGDMPGIIETHNTPLCFPDLVCGHISDEASDEETELTSYQQAPVSCSVNAEVRLGEEETNGLTKENGMDPSTPKKKRNYSSALNDNILEQGEVNVGLFQQEEGASQSDRSHIKQKKKKRKKEKSVVDIGMNEELSHVTSYNLSLRPELADFPSQVDESRKLTISQISLELTVPQTEHDLPEQDLPEQDFNFDLPDARVDKNSEMPDSNTSKKKKKKKKKRRFSEKDEDIVQSSCNTISGQLNEDVEIQRKKKKKKTLLPPTNRHDVYYGNDISHNSEGMDNKNIEESEKAFKALADQDAEPLTKKKKQKTISETSVSSVSEDTVEQCEDFVSARKNKKGGSSSFHIDDTVEKDPKTHKGMSPSSATLNALKTRRQKSKGVGDNVFNHNLAQVENDNNPESVVTEVIDAVRKERKKKTLISGECIIHSDEAEQMQNECENSVPEAERCSDSGIRKNKRKRKGKSDTPVECVVDYENLQPPQTVALKKKKKKLVLFS